MQQLFCMAEKWAASVFVEQHKNKGEGVSKSIVFERSGFKGLKESNFCCFCMRWRLWAAAGG